MNCPDIRDSAKLVDQILVQPSVSVVVPTLNRAGFLRRTIDSIVAQDYEHIECIVVDGGSTDGSIEILKSYGERIRWVSEPDEGHADAINKGWRASNGEIIAWLNADDAWAVPDAARIAVEHFQSYPDTDVVYGNCGHLDLSGNVTRMSYPRKWDLEFAVLHCHHCINQPTAFLRRSIVEKVGWLDTNFYQKKDHELWLRIGLAGTIRYIPHVLAYASTHQGLSFDGPTAAPACVQVTTKFYSLPNIPEPLQAIRRRAFSNSYLRGAAYAWVGGRHGLLAARYAAAAVLKDPSNVVGLARHAARLVRHTARRLSGRNSLFSPQ